jgi:hypothetical protein
MTSRFGSTTLGGSISKFSDNTTSGPSNFSDLGDCSFDSNNYIIINGTKYTKYIDYLELRSRIEEIEKFIFLHFNNNG